MWVLYGILAEQHRGTVNADAGDSFGFVSGPYAAFDIFDHAALIDRPEQRVVSAAQRRAGSTACGKRRD